MSALPDHAPAGFTGEQLRAVSRRDGSLFLAAGAGSGKTRVLVERFVRAVLEDGVAVDRILAITFTEKAAGELATRIRRRFVELGERDRAREAEGAWISTIHGFCARVLRAHPLQAGIDPEFRVLDEPTAARIAIDAFDRALQDFLADSARTERLDLAASYTPEKLERMVRAVYRRLRTRGERRPRLPAIDPPDAPDADRERLERAIAASGPVLASACDGAMVDAARRSLEALAAALEAVPPGRFGAAGEFGELALRRGNAKALAAHELDELAEALDAWVAGCAGAKAYEDYKLLARLVELYGRHYEELKVASGMLDFDDLELATRDLLARDGALRAAVAGRFEQLMVDEFQDTNPLQVELLGLVSRGNLFTVGDEFQSIYGFRGADVEGFRTRAGEAARLGEHERLTTTFRMGPELVATVNAVFAPIFGDAYAPLASAPDRPADPPGAAPRVELLAVDKDKRRWEEALGEHAFGETLRTTPWRAAEARLVAARVDELTSGPQAPYTPGDVAVLVRAATELDVYERALDERGIPTYAVGASGYWHRQEIADLRAYLATVANPRDELSLYNVLASPLVGVSLDTLALIRQHARADRRDVWWALEEGFSAEGDGARALADALPGGERERVAEFVVRLSGERREAPRLSLETLIDRAVTATGYDVAVLSMRDGARRMANVRKLMRLAREFEAENGRDLRGLIDHIDEQELVAAREAEAPLEGEGVDAVRLMTVHAAKGLEFPVVVIADLGRDARADHGPLQVSQDGRVGLEVASLTGRRDAALELKRIREEQEQEAEGEERRIFYVAMTRAQQHLILSGGVDVSRRPEIKPLGAPIAWIAAALWPELWEREAELAAGVASTPGGARAAWKVLTPETVDELLPPADRIPAPPVSVPAAAGTLEPPSFPPVVEERALPVARLSYSALESYRRCGYRFYLERVVGMRPARPVPVETAPAVDGQLALSDADDALVPAPARAGLDPLVRGTVVHALLERIDFARPVPPETPAAVDALQSVGADATSAEIDEITGMIRGFLDSPLAARLGRARRVRREVPFAFTLTPSQPLLINGVLDVHADEADGVLVVDYKTDAVGDDPASVCERKYSTQRLVYALAALRAGATRVEVVYSFLERPLEPVSTVFTAADAARLEQDLIALAADLVAGSFEPSDAPHRDLCLLCPGQAALCKWGPERTLAETP